MNIPAPRSNHVKVYINDNYYGLYINVEHIDEEFIKQIANKLIIFDQGKVFMFHGNYEDFTKKIGWKESEYEQIY